MAEQESAAVRWCVLGEVHLVVDGEMRPLAGQRQRAVAAQLALAAPASVSAGQLIRLLWPVEPPKSARNSVQRFVSDLRRQLDEHADCIIGSSVGYRIATERRDIDAHYGADLISQSRAAAAAGDLHEAVAGFDEALALWTGPALGGTGPVRYESGLAVGLNEMRLRALEEVAVLRAELGEHRRIVEDLDGLVSEHPGREGLWLALARAQSASGLQQRAASTFRRLRADIAATGLVPSKAVSEAEAAVFSSADDEHRNGQHPKRRRSDHDASDGLPASLAIADGEPFFGREKELDELLGLLDQRSGSEQRAAFISGEAGIGKSRLAAELAGRAQQAGWRVAFGRSSEQVSASFESWVDVLSSLVDRAGDDLIDGHIERHGGLLVSLIPALAQRRPEAMPAQHVDPDARAQQLRVLAAVLDLLDRLGSDQRTLIVLDDEQWATPTSTALLGFVLDRVKAGLAIVVTFRDNEVAADAPLRTLIVSTPSGRPHHHLRLVGLEEGDIAALLAAREPAAGTGQIEARSLLDRTGGNPLFVRELLRYLDETEDLLADGSGSASGVLPDVVPDSVQRIVDTRVARLDRSTGQHLAAAAVLGREFSIPRLSRMLGGDTDAVIDACERAESAGLVAFAGVDDVVFIHDLVRSALEQSLAPARRARLHLAAADALDEHSTDPRDATDRAVHLVSAGELAAVGRCVEACLATARLAASRYASLDAVRWFEEALAQYDRSPDRIACAAVSVELAVQQRHLGNSDHVATLRQATDIALETRDADLLITCGLADLGPTAASLYFPSTERLDLLEAALGACADDDSAERSMLMASVGTLLYGPDLRARRIALQAEALAMAERVGDPHAQANALLRIARSNPDPRPLDEVAELNKRVASLIADGDIDDPMLEFSLLRSELTVAYIVADGRRVDELVEQAIAKGAQFPIAMNRLGALYCQALQASVHGDVPRFQRLNDEAFVLGSELGIEESAGVYQSNLVYLWGLQGRGGDVADGIKDWAAQYPDVSAYQSGAASVLNESGRSAEASRALERFASGELEPPDTSQWIFLMNSWGLSAWMAGDLAVVDKVLTALRPHRHLVATYVNHVMQPVALLTAYLAGRLGRFDEALVDCELARAVAERLDGQWMRLAADQALAEVLLRRNEPGDVERAKNIAADVIDAATTFGYGGLYQRASFVVQTDLFGADAALPSEAFVQIEPLPLP